MHTSLFRFRHLLERWVFLGFLLLCYCTVAFAQQSAIRKNLPARLQKLIGSESSWVIDEVRSTPIPGLYEVRINHSMLLYSDAQGDFFVQGSLVNARSGLDLTQQRLDQITAVVFKDLPFADAFTIVRGNGKRKMAIFSDPNCGYCKTLERDLNQLNNITVHVFLYPILGPDSTTKARNIWCASDKAKTYIEWMLQGIKPPEQTCATPALSRNMAWGQKMHITGTPTLLFTDNSRVPGL